MMARAEFLFDFLNSVVWSKAMLVAFISTGLVFSVGLHLFQFCHFSEMWKGLSYRGRSDAGISVFQSFCTTMASRIGTGNVAGVALALSLGGPGTIFWMWVVAITNSALSFVECTLGQLYKTKIDGTYRGGSAYCALSGLGWKRYAVVSAFVLAVGTSCFLPAAASYTMCDSLRSATGIPPAITAGVICMLFFFVVCGGIRRIGNFFAVTVPFMTVIYLAATMAIIVPNIQKVPGVFALIVSSAFGRNAVFGGIAGSAFAQGAKRGSFSSGAGMGESTPAAAAAEVPHPIRQGFVNAGGVWIDTIIVCTATGLALLLTGCYNVFDPGGNSVYAGPGLRDLGIEGGIEYVQSAFSCVLGDMAPMTVSIVLFFFIFTCIVGYYYEAESALLYLFKGKSGRLRTRADLLLRIVMTILVFVFSIVSSPLAWSISDFAFGICAWANILVLWLLFPRVRRLYLDYISQLKDRGDPVFTPIPSEWPGVDTDIWNSIGREAPSD